MYGIGSRHCFALIDFQNHFPEMFGFRVWGMISDQNKVKNLSASVLFSLTMGVAKTMIVYGGKAWSGV